MEFLLSGHQSLLSSFINTDKLLIQAHTLSLVLGNRVLSTQSFCMETDVFVSSCIYTSLRYSWILFYNNTWLFPNHCFHGFRITNKSPCLIYMTEYSDKIHTLHSTSVALNPMSRISVFSLSKSYQCVDPSAPVSAMVDGVQFPEE